MSIREKVNMVKKDELLLSKEEIMAAVEESQDVKKKYPNFWKFYQMLLVINDNEMFNFERDDKNVK
jgi:hypothetical protein